MVSLNPRIIAVIVAAVVVVGLVAFAFLAFGGGTDDQNLYKCPDGTLVNRADQCPNPLKLGVYSTMIVATFTDETTKVLTQRTPFEQLAVTYIGKTVMTFDFTSSFDAGDSDIRIQVRPEIDLVAPGDTLVRGQTGDLVEKTIARGQTESLFSMTIDPTFFANVFPGDYDLRFVSHILKVEVLNPDGSVEQSKAATLTYGISVSVTTDGGGGGGGCKYPNCAWPQIQERLREPTIQTA